MVGKKDTDRRSSDFRSAPYSKDARKPGQSTSSTPSNSRPGSRNASNNDSGKNSLIPNAGVSRTNTPPGSRLASRLSNSDGELIVLARDFQHADAFEKFLKSSLFTATEKLGTETGLGDLDCPILPIFRVENFEGVGVEEYAVLEPSLRLASQLLMHVRAKELFRTLLCHGDLVCLGERDNESKEMYTYTQADSEARALTAQEEVIVATAFDELAGFVTFVADAERDVGDANTNALADSVAPPEGTRVLFGTRSRTKFALAVAQRLAGLTAKVGTEEEDVAALLACRFAFGVELAHEMVHALTFAKSGREASNDTETFLHGQNVAEVGFEFEHRIFGGHVALLWSEEEIKLGENEAVSVRAHRNVSGEVSGLNGVLVQWPWPSRHIVRFYQAQNLALWERKQGVTSRADKKEVGWRVQVADLARFFTNAFWAGYAEGAILKKTPRVPKADFKMRVGCAFESNVRTGERPDRSVLEKGEYSRCVPDGYEVREPFSDIVRKGYQG